LVILSAAGTLGAYSSYAMRPNAPVAAASTQDAQVPNRTGKADRIAAPFPATLAATEEAPFSLASTAFASAADWQLTNRMQDAPPVAFAEPSPEVLPPPKAELKVAALPPRAAEKSKRLPPPPPSPNAFLDDAQIEGIKTRLRLTSDQAEYWPAVEAALRDVARTQIARLKHTRSRGPATDLCGDAAADAAARRPEGRGPQARAHHRPRFGRIADLTRATQVTAQERGACESVGVGGSR
jgi:hypothetical protein